MAIVLVRIGMDAWFIGFRIDTVWLNVKVLLAIIRLSLFVSYVNKKESSYMDLERVVKMLEYLFKLRIKLID